MSTFEGCRTPDTEAVKTQESIRDMQANFMLEENDPALELCTAKLAEDKSIAKDIAIQWLNELKMNIETKNINNSFTSLQIENDLGTIFGISSKNKLKLQTESLLS